MLISVVVPTRNRRQWVHQAVASVLEQLPVPGVWLELCVVDDGSKDGTADSLRERFGERLRLLRFEHSQGVAAARNAGVEASHGEWIAFLDSDDYWLPAKMREQWWFTREQGCLVSQTEEIWFRYGRLVQPRSYHRKPDGDIFLPSLERCLVSPSAVLLHRSVWEETGGFDPGLPACEDYDLWLRIARRHPVRLCPKALVVKRGGHPDQLSRQFWGMDRFRLAALVRLLVEGALDEERLRAVVQVMERKAEVLARGAEKRGRREEAERYRALVRWACSWVEGHNQEAA